MKYHILLCFFLFAFGIQSQHIIVQDSVWLFVSGDHDTCIESIVPRHPKTEKIFNKAKALYAKGKVEKAKVLYDKAVEIDPKYYAAIMARAEFHEANGQYDLAIDEYSLALKMLPCEKKPHLERGRVHLVTEHWGSAIQDFQEYLKWSTVNPEIYPMIATALFATGNEAAACEFLKKGVELEDPKCQSIFNEKCK